ncbi:SIS domain-containing protein [Pseudovibrio sp. Ad26]|uniref:SIS domain-containing protein n=1 Tax=Pseudovibrio sp. Ad26 TaxID=989410 RepID=UPI0007AE6E0B|nr:SIS domain-containing protein [Pseudovibrio sp. Ad26]KZL16321.1 Phosphoheptose isomerase [Pseudovibrio sp. Ad26]
MQINTKSFLDEYFEEYKKLTFTQDAYENIDKFASLASRVQATNNKLMFAGNGASASIAAHGAVDFTKQGKVRGVTFHDANLMTCFANDFGYDHWIAKALEHYADDGDAVVLISVSGKSPSVVNAAKYAKARGLPVISFSAQTIDNPLRQLSDIKFFVPSMAYNIVENIHSIWLTSTIDAVIGKAEYTTRALVDA